MGKNNYDLIAVLGPTACGKTAFAARLCHLVDGEIISADSRQVYRNMNIGTGKDYNDYVVNGRIVPFHLIDIAEPGYKYNIFEYRQDFIKTYNDIVSRQKIPVLCGGSGLYINAATGSYRLAEVPPNVALRNELQDKSLEELTKILSSKKKLHNRTDTDTKEHAIRAIEIALCSGEGENIPDPVPGNILFIGIRYERQEERRRITERLHRRLEEGMVEEVRTLLNSSLSAEDAMYYGLEYKFVTLYITGRLQYDEMVAKLNTAIHQFSKRQMTWFRKMEKEGIPIYWIEGSLPMQQKVDRVMELFKGA